MKKIKILLSLLVVVICINLSNDSSNEKHYSEDEWPKITTVPGTV